MWAEIADQYLSNIQCTLWPAVAFDVSDDVERARAAQWLAQTIRDALWQAAK